MCDNKLSKLEVNVEVRGFDGMYQFGQWEIELWVGLAANRLFSDS
jgi:hypothetical protein